MILRSKRNLVQMYKIRSHGSFKDTKETLLRCTWNNLNELRASKVKTRLNIK